MPSLEKVQQAERKDITTIQGFGDVTFYTLGLIFDPRRARRIQLKDTEGNNLTSCTEILERNKQLVKEYNSYVEDEIRRTMQGASTGYMVYQCLMHFESSPFRQFRVTMNEQHRVEQLEKLVKETISLQNARKAKDPSLARHVYSDRELNWLCRECPYAKECERLRAAASGAAA